MSRIIKFKRTNENTYNCFENNNNIFTIKQDDMLFDVKEFYNGIYKNQNDYDIQLEKDIDENDKVGIRIYESMLELISLISKNLKNK